MRSGHVASWLVVGALALVGCKTGGQPPPPEVAPPPVAPERAPLAFAEALEALERADAQGWTKGECKRLSAAFSGVADALANDENRSRQADAARFNQAVVLSRCDDPRALKIFSRLAARHHDSAMAMTARERVRRGALSRDAAIEVLRQGIVAAAFAAPDSLTLLGRWLRERGEEDDLVEAKQQLQRALARRPRDARALGELALVQLAMALGPDGAGQLAAEHHLELAASDKRSADSKATLEMALLVCDQGLRVAPRNARLHNVRGLVQAARRDDTAAARDFAEARKLDPSLFAAHMNHAAVLSRFRGFDEAERAYRVALKLRPDDYDAKVGLALALRGQAAKKRTDAATRQRTEARQLLVAARAAAPQRPEAYFNHALLITGAPAEGGVAKACTPQTRELFEQARERSNDAEMRARADGWLKDLQVMCQFTSPAP